MRMLRNGLCARLAILGLCLAAAVNPCLAAGEESATVKLTGISALFGNKRALLLVQPAKRSGETPAQQSCILGEGESEGAIKVLRIDATAGRVRILNAGKEMELTLTRDGLDLPAPAATPAPTPQRAPEPALPAQATVTESPATIDPQPEPTEPVVIGRNPRRANPPRFRSQLIAPQGPPPPATRLPDRTVQTSPGLSPNPPPTILSAPYVSPQPASAHPLLQVPAKLEMPQPFQPPAYSPPDTGFREWSGSSASSAGASAAGAGSPKFQRPVLAPPPSPPSP